MGAREGYRKEAVALKERAAKVEELLAKRDELMISNLEWAALTNRTEGCRKVSYQTIRRMEIGEALPRHATLRSLELALTREEEARVASGARAAA